MDWRWFFSYLHRGFVTGKYIAPPLKLHSGNSLKTFLSSAFDQIRASEKKICPKLRRILSRIQGASKDAY